MNILSRQLVLGVLLLAVSGGSVLAQTRIAIVDLSKAFDGYWKKKEAEATIKQRAEDVSKELKTMVEDIKKAREVYTKLVSDASDQAVSSEEREKRKKLAEDKLKQVKDLEDTANQYNRSASSSLDEQRKRVIEKIVNEIREVLAAKAKKDGFSLVVDISALSGTGTPVIPFHNNENDLTKDLIEDLNRAAPAALPKDSEPKSDKKTEKKK